MRHSSFALVSAVVASAVLVSACGGDFIGFLSDADAKTPLAGAEGLYTGTTSTGRTLTNIVLNDGSFYLFYSAANQANAIRGFIQGASAATNGNFTSSNARDINTEGSGAMSATISGSHSQRKWLNGNINYSAPAQVVSFTSTYSPAYESTPTLAAIAGTYNGFLAEASSVAGGPSTTLTISATGAVTMSNAPCTGTVTPRTVGNAYNVTLSCNTPSVTSFTGIAYYDTTAGRLYLGALLGDRTNGRLFTGTRL